VNKWGINPHWKIKQPPEVPEAVIPVERFRGLLLLENREPVLALRNDIAIREGVQSAFPDGLGKKVNGLVTTTLQHGGLGMQEIRVPL
jgi:hypothetical protein